MPKNRIRTINGNQFVNFITKTTNVDILEGLMLKRIIGIVKTFSYSTDRKQQLTRHSAEKTYS